VAEVSPAASGRANGIPSNGTGSHSTDASVRGERDIVRQQRQAANASGTRLGDEARLLREESRSLLVQAKRAVRVAGTLARERSTEFRLVAEDARAHLRRVTPAPDGSHARP
jgi:hypothetical protein